MTSGITLGIAALGALLAAILPTGLFVYVEPRGRAMWARRGDTAATRRAPVTVRAAAWACFLAGEMAVVWLVVPVVCAGLVYLQAKLGLWRPIGIASTAAVGVAAVLQSAAAVRLLPMGVRLLMRDARACADAATWARWMGWLNAAVLAGGMTLDWAVRTVPRFVHPWLAAVLGWAALRPVTAFACASIVVSLLLSWAAARATAATGATATTATTATTAATPRRPPPSNGRPNE